MRKKVENFLDRFWDRIDVRDENSCWEWLAGKNRGGYGAIRPKSKCQMFAHRLMWELANAEEIPPGLHVMHSCDNPSCVNPKHLSLGTRSDNMSDMVRKGRGSVGEKNGSSKLRTSEVLEIKRLISEGKMFHREIAAIYNVSRTHMSDIKSGRRWKHLNEPRGEE
jgi:hypothetical protein